MIRYNLTIKHILKREIILNRLETAIVRVHQVEQIYVQISKYLPTNKLKFIVPY